MRGETLTGIVSVLIKIHTDEDIIGIGDAGGTSAWYRGETQESIMGMINGVFAPLLLGENPCNIEKLVDKMDFVSRDNNQAKALVDYALHDIKGKRYGVPVYELLGGRSTEKLKLGWVLSAGTPDDVAAHAVEAVAAGFDILKLKTGHSSMEEDIKMVAAVREAVGNSLELFIDVNGFWDYYNALTTLKKLEKYNLALVEQPVPWWDIRGMARLRNKIGIPVFADESAGDPRDLLDIIRQDAADGLFLKVPKAGGFIKSQRWIAIAQDAGLRVHCGCMAGSGVEAAIYTHLLAANAWTARFAHENLGPLHIHDVFDTSDNSITDDIALRVPRYENGYLYTTEEPGLGVEFNEEIIPTLVTPGKSPTSVSL